MKRRPRNTGPIAAVVDLVYERSGYVCELDAAHVGPERGRDHHIHHRRPRRMGGSQLPDTNLPQNLMLLCPDCHERVESERSAAYAGGWLVRQQANPADVPVLVHGQRWVLLTPQGEYASVPNEPAEVA